METDISFCKARSMTTDTPADRLRRAALGAFLQIARSMDNLSAEAMAVRAGLGHMTWRRLEEGHVVRPQSYAAVEEVFKLPSGTLRAALNDDESLVALAQALGVDTSAAKQGTTPAADFLATFVSGHPGVLIRHATNTSRPTDRLETVQALISHLARRQDRSTGEDAALQGLMAWLGELVTAGGS